MNILLHLRLKLFSFIKKEIDQRRYRIWRVRGLIRLYYFAYRILKPKGIVLAEAQGFKLYVNTLDDVIAPEIMVYGFHEKDETELFKKIVKPSMVVIDIGANMGYYSLLAAKLVGDKGKIYAFEPDPINYNLLVDNIKINQFTNIVPIQKAVSNKIGKIKLFLDKENFGGHTLSHKNIQTKQNGFLEVETTTIQDFLKGEGNIKVDLIKMDVQGSEGLVIEKAFEIIMKNNLKILMEFWPSGLLSLGTDPVELLQRLQNYGFAMNVVESQGELCEIRDIMVISKLCESKNFINLFLEKKRNYSV